MATNSPITGAAPSSNANNPLGANPYRQYMSPPPNNDATIDIPLEPVATHSSQTGLRGTSGSSSVTANDHTGPAPVTNEKSGGLFHRSHKGRRRAMKLNSKGEPVGGSDDDDNEEGALTSMGLLYSKILNSSIVTRYFILILPLGIAIAVPIVIGATVAPNATIGGVRIVWLFVWVEIGECDTISRFNAFFFFFVASVLHAADATIPGKAERPVPHFFSFCFLPWQLSISFIAPLGLANMNCVN